MNLNDIVAGLPEWLWEHRMLVWFFASLIWLIGANMYFGMHSRRERGKVSVTAKAFAWPLWLITWPLRRWWRGRRKRGKGVLLIPVTVHDDGRAATAAVAYYGNRIRLNAICYETTSGDARAGDCPVGSDPSEPPPMAGSAAGRPYGSKPDGRLLVVGGPFESYEEARSFATSTGRDGWCISNDNPDGSGPSKCFWWVRLPDQHNTQKPNAPYGSAPPVNHTVERVDDLERRMVSKAEFQRLQDVVHCLWLDAKAAELRARKSK